MMLEVQGLNAYYGKSHILQGVDMHIDAGEVVSLLGRNGVGRSTTVKAIMGEVPPHGSIMFNGSDIAGLPSYRIARLGLGYVPEHRDIFPGLTVRQNLVLGIKDTRLPGKWRLEDMLEMFPNLAARADTAAGVLSGGEKQMPRLRDGPRPHCVRGHARRTKGERGGAQGMAGSVRPKSIRPDRLR
jgi:branched-chain amino acid transport system ATP-binding protein